MNINTLTLQELLELNKNVVKRIRELRRMKLYATLQNFTEGDIVSFNNNGTSITGIVIRINQKSLTVKTNEGTWYIDPCLAVKAKLPQQNNNVDIFRNSSVEANCSNN